MQAIVNHIRYGTYLHKQGAMVGVGGKRYGMSPLDRSDCIKEIRCILATKDSILTLHTVGIRLCIDQNHLSELRAQAPSRVVAEYSGAYLCSHTSNR